MVSFLTLPLDSGTAIAFVKLQLEQSGFHVSFAFDVDSSCASFTENACPHNHGQKCCCHLTILQISDRKENSLPLALHTLDGKTDFSLPDQPEQDDELHQIIRRALTSREIIRTN